MKKTLFFALIFLSAGCAAKVAAPAPLPAKVLAPVNNYSSVLIVGTQTLNVEIAKSPAAMEQGLSGRTPLADNQGMLFDFGADNVPGFWMKDMNFNLDFIWIDKNKIVGITPDAPAPAGKVSDASLPLYYPPAPVDNVLEVPAGWSAAHAIHIGDDVKLK